MVEWRSLELVDPRGGGGPSVEGGGLEIVRPRAGRRGPVEWGDSRRVPRWVEGVWARDSRQPAGGGRAVGRGSAV